ncbi:MAG: hypothetical protein V4671_01980 [Armatimonadota bacterium]
MNVSPYGLFLLMLFSVAAVTAVTAVTVSHAQTPGSKAEAPKYDVAKLRRMEGSDLATYPANGYRFATPSGWTFGDSPKGFMKAKTISTAVGPTKLQIKFLMTPADGYAGSKKGELLRQTEEGLRRQLQKEGFEQVNVSATRYRNYPAYEAQYLVVRGGKRILSRALSFDNGKGIFLVRGTINPAPASPGDRPHAEFDRAWKQVLRTLTLESTRKSDNAK